jgi:hypothetical protein
VTLDVEEELLVGALRKHTASAPDRWKRRLDCRADLLDLREIGAGDLQPDKPSRFSLPA